MGVIELTTMQWLLAGLAAFFVGLTKAGFGSGAGIVAVPLMAVAFGAEQMLPIMLILLICGDIFSIIHYPRAIDRRNIALLVPGCVVGVGIGWVLLVLLMKHGAQQSMNAVLDPFVGATCIVFVGIQVWRFFQESRLTQRPEPYRPTMVHGLALGTVAGVTSTLSHAAGPLIALFLLPQKMDKRVFVGTSVAYFFFGNLIKFVPYTFQNLFDRTNLSTAFVLLPIVVLGTFAGVVLNRHVPGRAFTLIIYAVAFLTGLKLIF